MFVIVLSSERTSGGTGPSMDKVSPNLTLPCRRNNKRLAQVSEPFWLSLKSKRNLASTDPETGRQENKTARLAQKSRLARQHSAGSRNQTRPKLRRPQVCASALENLCNKSMIQTGHMFENACSFFVQERRPVEGILVVL